MDSLLSGVVAMVVFGLVVLVVHAMRDAAKTRLRMNEALQRARVFRTRTSVEADASIEPRRISRQFGRR